MLIKDVPVCIVLQIRELFRQGKKHYEIKKLLLPFDIAEGQICKIIKNPDFSGAVDKVKKKVVRPKKKKRRKKKAKLIKKVLIPIPIHLPKEKVYTLPKRQESMRSDILKAQDTFISLFDRDGYVNLFEGT